MVNSYIAATLCWLLAIWCFLFGLWQVCRLSGLLWRIACYAVILVVCLLLH